MPGKRGLARRLDKASGNTAWPGPVCRGDRHHRIRALTSVAFRSPDLPGTVRYRRFRVGPWNRRHADARRGDHVREI